MAARVLVADDDEAIRLLVSRALSLHGFDVHVASDGEDALRQLEETPSDLVVLDLMMPKLDGIGVIEALAKHHKVPRIIVMTAAAPSITARIPQQHVWKVLGKPFEMQQLLDCAKSAVGER